MPLGDVDMIAGSCDFADYAQVSGTCVVRRSRSIQAPHTMIDGRRSRAPQLPGLRAVGSADDVSHSRSAASLIAST